MVEAAFILLSELVGRALGHDFHRDDQNDRYAQKGQKPTSNPYPKAGPPMVHAGLSEEERREVSFEKVDAHVAAYAFLVGFKGIHVLASHLGRDFIADVE